jgi:hypothetical protein
MKNRIVLILLLLVTLHLELSSQCQSWEWGKSATGSGSGEGLAVTSDLNGNSYITGSFDSPTLTFGAFTLSHVGTYSNLFIAKYDVFGNVIWAKSAGIGGSASGGDLGLSLSNDIYGNIYLSGIYKSSSITFGGNTLVNPTGGGPAAFIVRYDSLGNVHWAKSISGSIGADGWSSKADNLGNVYLTGDFSSPTISFGTYTLTNASSTSNDYFIVKYDSLGVVKWAKRAGGGSGEQGKSVAADKNGNVYVTGSFSSPSILFGTTTLIRNPSVGSDIFIVKYDSDGTVIWAKSAGGNDMDYPNSILVDNKNEIYLTGGFRSSTISFDGYVLSNSGSGNIFISKYDALGNVVWAKTAVNGGGSGYSLCQDASGSIFIGGSFVSPSITFDSTTINVPVGSYDPMFILKVDPTGNILCNWALTSGGDDQNGLSADGNDNVYVVGDFVVNSMPYVLGIDSILVPYGEQIFLAKLSNNPTTHIYEFNNENIFNLFPNPSDGLFTIKCNLKAESLASIKIYNILGKKIEEQEFNSNELQIDGRNLTDGIYFLQLCINGKIAKSEKLIISK